MFSKSFSQASQQLVHLKKESGVAKTEKDIGGDLGDLGDLEDFPYRESENSAHFLTVHKMYSNLMKRKASFLKTSQDVL